MRQPKATLGNQFHLNCHLSWIGTGFLEGCAEESEALSKPSGKETVID